MKHSLCRQEFDDEDVVGFNRHVGVGPAPDFRPCVPLCALLATDGTPVPPASLRRSQPATQAEREAEEVYRGSKKRERKAYMREYMRNRRKRSY